METIFHEKQEGLLCAQHCLNNLLQDAYFTAVELATLAQQIDDEERKTMAEGGESEEYRRFIAKPSDNMDDSGYFSVQVIASALKVWSLDLIPFNSQNKIAIEAQERPELQKAYICNYREHWFTIRKIGKQWFNLNSLLSGPELISDTYLSLFLTQLQKEGYSIFIVNGILPNCKADGVLSQQIVVQNIKPKLLTENTKPNNKNNNENNIKQRKESYNEEEERELQRVLQMSIESNDEAERRQIEAALAMSLETTTEIKNRNSPVFNTEEEMLDAALKMSLEAL